MLGRLSAAEVAAFRADIEAGCHPRGEGLEPNARLIIQPSIESVPAQQQLLENARWMAVQRRLLDIPPGYEPPPERPLTCHHSACLVRTPGNRSVEWYAPVCLPLRSCCCLSCLSFLLQAHRQQRRPAGAHKLGRARRRQPAVVQQKRDAESPRHVVLLKWLSSDQGRALRHR